MAYMSELGAGWRVYLDNPGGQTVVTVMTSSLGQQQQSSSSVKTGDWLVPPTILRSPERVVIQITIAQGQQFIHLQGSQMSVSGVAPVMGSFQQMQLQTVQTMPESTLPSMPSMPPMQPMQPMQPIPHPSASSPPPIQPMQPMQPLQMDGMTMNLGTMEMRMGNMEMRMGNPSVSSAAGVTSGGSAEGSAASPQPNRRFCSQCGASVEVGDRFCSSFGHRLS